MKNILLAIAAVFISAPMYSQNFCSTPAVTTQAARQSLTRASSRSNGDTLAYFLKVYFHVIRQSNGMGGQSYSNVSVAFNNLNGDFNPHRIYFIWDGAVDYIDNTNLYQEASDTVFSINNHQDGIDIYLFPYTNWRCGGRANGVGVSSEFFVSGKYEKYPYPSYVTSHAVSHEMGHVLNLFHTHNGTYEPERYPGDCAELVNGSNSDCCGDFIVDTPADPNLAFNVNPVTYTWGGSGIDANGDSYNPDVRLIMSYTDIRCMTYFSPMQGKAMRSAIDDLTFLQNTIIEPSIAGKSAICDTATYVLNNVPDGLSVSWGIDNPNFSVSSSGRQCYVSYIPFFSLYEVANLTATITKNGQILKNVTKRIVMHSPFMYVQGYQPELDSENGYCPERFFTIPEEEEELRQRTLTSQSVRKFDAQTEVSLPIHFTEEFLDPLIPPEYGITDIYGGNNVTLSSSRFDGMDISFSGSHAPVYYDKDTTNVRFQMPGSPENYYVVMNAEGGDGCHDFSLTFRVIPMYGQSSGEPDILLSFSGSTMFIYFVGETGNGGSGPINIYPWDVSIYHFPVVSYNNPVYHTVVSGSQGSTNVYLTNWSSGIYIIRIVQNGLVYTKKFAI